MGYVPPGDFLAFKFLFLGVDRYGYVRDTSVRQSRTACKIRNTFDMTSPHNTSVVNRDIHEHLVQLDILLCMCLDKIMILKARDRQNRRPIELRIVQTVY